MRRPALVSMLLALLAPIAVLRAQDSVFVKQLNGDWSGTLVMDASRAHITMSFAVTDSTFRGDVTADGAPFGPMQGLVRKGNQVSFHVDVYEFTCVMDGTQMRVDMVMYNGSHRSFTAEKAKPPKPF